MYRGVAIWNYAGDAVENAQRFADAGLTPSVGTRRYLWTATRTMTARAWPNISSVPASISRCTTCCPSPYDPQEIASARKAWRILADWHDKYHLLHGMTFDFWHPHDDQLPLYRECLEIFRGKGVFLACEDTPLNARTMEKFAKYLTPEDDVGILIDLGHMNVRQWMSERARARRLSAGVPAVAHESARTAPARQQGPQGRTPRSGLWQFAHAGRGGTRPRPLASMAS